MRTRKSWLLLLALPALTGFSVHGDLGDWEAAVGAHALETFDAVPDQGIPEEGGSIVLDGFAIEADGNHGSANGGCPELCPPMVQGGFFRGDVHDSPPEVSYNEFVFHAPVSAFALELFDVEDNLISVYGDGFSELVYVDDDERLFLGFVLDAPVSRFGFGADFQGFSVDDVRWVTAIPEPSTALLLGAGLVAVSARHRRTR